jgi:holo-[acyl-carrier protein] synthase
VSAGGVRVGIDLASEAVVRASLDAHGDRYLRRVFTAPELAQCGPRAPDPRRLATLVAAKEATFKALRVDDRPVAWTDVQVLGAFSGAPKLWLKGSAANLAREEGIQSLVLGLTGSKGAAAAAVVVARQSKNLPKEDDQL